MNFQSPITVTANRSSEELEMRALIVPELRRRYPTARIIHELPLRYSARRIDLAAVTEDAIVAVEIKSSRDVIDRLEAQLRAFNPICQNMYVALAPKWNEQLPMLETKRARGITSYSHQYTEAQQIIEDVGSSQIGIWTVDAAAGTRDRIGAELQDPDWPGDAKVAGWWLWGQCCWIGSGWCDWSGAARRQCREGDAGDWEGADDATSAGMGIQAIGQVPHAGNAGRGLMTSCGRSAMAWLGKIADRLERVRITHGHWSRCLNSHYGGNETAVFLDPPYRAYENLYGKTDPVADEVAAWAKKNGNLRIALCGHKGDYDLPDWTAVEWSRGRLTYSGKKTTDQECVWYSPACIDPTTQLDLLSEIDRRAGAIRPKFSEIWNDSFYKDAAE
jgi:16S rRNA G966 N2-methylase RsmD